MTMAIPSPMEWWDAQLYRCQWCGRLRLPSRLMLRQHQCGTTACLDRASTGEVCERVAMHGGPHDDGDGVTW